MTGRLIVITIFFFITNPISSHIIARFAWQNGIVPWKQSLSKRRKQEESCD
jgi:multicomponent Na+:H+ antiporter subunit G